VAKMIKTNLLINEAYKYINWLELQQLQVTYDLGILFIWIPNTNFKKHYKAKNIKTQIAHDIIFREENFIKYFTNYLIKIIEKRLDAGKDLRFSELVFSGIKNYKKIVKLKKGVR
jgi:hypothetical protein